MTFRAAQPTMSDRFLPVAGLLTAARSNALLYACGLFLLLSVTPVFSAVDENADGAATVLKVVMDDNYPPYVFRDSSGMLNGYLVDLWKLWESKTGVHVDLVATDWDHAQQIMAAGQADVIDTIFRTPERERVLNFTPPYADIPVPIYTYAGIGGITDLNTLRGFLVGVKAGDACADKLEAGGVTTLQRYRNYEALVQAAAAGQIRVFCLDEPPANYLLYRDRVEQNFHKAFTLYTGAFHRAVHKGDTKTLALLQQGFSLITPAELSALQDKWMGQRLPDTLSRAQIYGLWVAAFMIFALTALSLVLRYLVGQRTALLKSTCDRLGRLTKLYAALSQCNQAIVRSAGEAELFPQICRDAVQFGGMKMAWIGLVDESSQSVKPAAAFGDGIEYLEGIRISVDADDPFGRGPVGTTIRENRPVWCQDFQHDPMTAPWHARGARVGWRAMASLPLHRNGVPVGTFALYASEANAFDEAARNLLAEMAMDISFALDNFDLKARQKRIEDALSASERDLQDAQKVGRIGSYIFDLTADTWRSTATLDAILGIGTDYPRTAAGWMEIVHPAHRDEMRSFLRSLIEQGQTLEMEFRILRIDDGTERWVNGRGKVDYDSDGSPLRMVGIIQDITTQKHAEGQLQLAAKVFEQSREGFFVTDAEHKIIMINHAFTDISGFSENEVLGKDPHMLAAGHQDQDFYLSMWEDINKQGHWQGEELDRRKDGSLYSRWLSISRVLDAQGRVAHYIGIFSDITRHKQDQEHIQRLAHFDTLTGLPNRVLLNDRISHALSMAQRSHTSLAVLFMDLDHFKNINDTLGHRIGDALLVQVAKRLSATIREEDTVSRLGGDEFILVLQDADADGTAHVAEKLLEAIAQPYRIEQHDLVITPSIGIAMFPADGQDFDTLSKCADVAMYRAKHNGRNNFCFFTTEMQTHLAHRLKLESALHHALEKNQLRLYYQPQISLADGDIIGAEALLRWQHPEFGMVSPAEFIPIAEGSGQIMQIGEWVLRTAVRQMKDWMDSGMTLRSIAVNLSAVQFRHPNLPELVTQILDSAQLMPKYLELELTEGVAMVDPVGAIAVMDSLHKRGIRMSIDDFGTGYSSLSYLKRFMVYKLKIDQSFVHDITDDPEDKAIVSAIISLANSLGLQTIAEGVETEGQLAFLRDQGCNEVQGYYFSKPLPAEQFEEFIRTKSQA